MVSQLFLGDRRVIEELPDNSVLVEAMWFVRTNPDCFGFLLGSRVSAKLVLRLSRNRIQWPDRLSEFGDLGLVLWTKWELSSIYIYTCYNRGNKPGSLIQKVAQLDIR